MRNPSLVLMTILRRLGLERVDDLFRHSAGVAASWHVAAVVILLFFATIRKHPKTRMKSMVGVG